MNSNIKDYIEADKYVVLNDNDPDLKPIVLSLPKPPPLKYIDGYGDYYKDQRFKRLVIPIGLINLEKEALDKTKDDLSTNKNNVVTLLKIQKKFWELLHNRNKELKKEINFIRKVWWHRIHGYWFFNRGKPTYISGWHFYYLNFWTMDTNDGQNRPAYRSRDRKEYLFAMYSYTATETFLHLDKDGCAIPNKDGTYSTIDLGRRICMGTIQPKNRRSGNTNKGLCVGMEIITRTIKTDGMGVQSYSNDNAEEHFKVKLMQAFEDMPIFLKPNTKSGRMADSLVFDVGKNEYGEESLQTKVTYATTSSEKFYDGKKMMFLLLDEEGKTMSCSVSKRWDVNKNTLAQGNGIDIHGYCSHPSTVDEMMDGAFDYRFLASESNFYKRVKATGQTYSGLFRLFLPAVEGFDECIDSYGESISYEIKKYQQEEFENNPENKKKKLQSAHSYLQGKRDALITRGDNESMRALREEKKLFPLKYADCFLGDAGGIGFNLDNIDKRQVELRREDPTIKCNFEWVGGIFGGDVYLVPDEVNGRCNLSEMPPDHVINKKVKTTTFNPIDNKNMPSWRPMYPTDFVVGVDTFRSLNRRQATVGSGIKKAGSKHSDGGISVLLKYNSDIDKGKQMSDWETQRFVLTYRSRHGSTYDFNEDVLKIAIYFGGMVYPETNLPNTYEYFLNHGYGGYLLYGLNKFTGKYKDKPGIDTLEGSKQELFALLRDYIEFRCHIDVMYQFLQECKEIKNMEEMRHKDMLASCAVALHGAQSAYAEEKYKKDDDNEYDAADYWDFQ